MDRDGGALTIVSLLLRWIVPLRSNIQRVMGEAETLTWSEAAEGLSQTKWRREQGSQRKARGACCSVFVLLMPRHVMFSYLSNPNFSHHPTIQLEDMIPFPCCIHYITGLSCLPHLQIYIVSCREGYGCNMNLKGKTMPWPENIACIIN